MESSSYFIEGEGETLGGGQPGSGRSGAIPKDVRAADRKRAARGYKLNRAGGEAGARPRLRGA
jgi:hypothetical protein